MIIRWLIRLFNRERDVIEDGVFVGELPMRNDDQGAGHFGAPRGSRTHKGVDYACDPGTAILCHVSGTVTKLGFPYADGVGGVSEGTDKAFRYVEVTESVIEGKVKHKFYYVNPCVEVGDEILIGDRVGNLDDLTRRYPGMTTHVHYQVELNGEVIDPMMY